MKIIPDRIYSHMQCGAARVLGGSAQILPQAASRVPERLIPDKWRAFVVPGSLLVVVVAGFYEPRILFVLVPAWAVTAWKLGECPHCRRLAGQESVPVTRTGDEE